MKSNKPHVRRVAVGKPTRAAAYAVQLGVYGQWANAVAAARTLRQRGLKPELVLAADQRPGIKLIVGHFRTRAEATAAARVYKRQRGDDAWVFVREGRQSIVDWRG